MKAGTKKCCFVVAIIGFSLGGCGRDKPLNLGPLYYLGIKMDPPDSPIILVDGSLKIFPMTPLKKDDGDVLDASVDKYRAVDVCRAVKNAQDHWECQANSSIAGALTGVDWVMRFPWKTGLGIFDHYVYIVASKNGTNIRVYSDRAFADADDNPGDRKGRQHRDGTLVNGTLFSDDGQSYPVKCPDKKCVIMIVYKACPGGVCT